MLRVPSWTFPVVGLVAVFGVIVSRADYESEPVQADRSAIVEPAMRGSAVAWSHGADGASANAEEHWSKHGGDFSELHSAEEYERAALEFVHHPPPGTIVKHRPNGDTLFFEPATGDFAVEDAQGEPRTFFRPHHGRAYWDRQ